MENPIKRFGIYTKGAYLELKKVQWPTPKETWRYSVLVVAVSLAVTGFLAGIDYLLGGVVDFLP